MAAKRGLTLIELLVVIAVIAVLASIITVNFSGAQERARIAKVLQFQSSMTSLLGVDIIGWWHFYECGGSEAVDYSGYENHGTIYGAQYSPETPLKKGCSMEFDRASHKRILASAVPVSTNLTLSAWIYPKEYPSERSTIIQGQSSAAYYLSLHGNGSAQTYWYGKSPAGYHSSPSGAVPLNTWTHVVGTWDEGQMIIYVNGVAGNPVNVTGAGVSPSVVNIGAESTSRQFVGMIGDVMIHSRALTASEIRQYYARTAPYYAAQEPLSISRDL